jgi:hypothetical protein
MTQQPDYWFKPHRYGYGAQPVTLKGWAVSIAYLVLVLVSLRYLPEVRTGEISAGGFLLWIAVIVGVTLSFVRFARRKTDGEWRWRWGDGE